MVESSTKPIGIENKAETGGSRGTSNNDDDNENDGTSSWSHHPHHYDGNNLSCDNNNHSSSQQLQQQQKAPGTKKQPGWLLSNDALRIHVQVLLLFLVGIWIWVLGQTLPVLPSQFWIKTGFGTTMGTFVVNSCFFGDCCYAAADAHWLLYHDRIRRLGDL